MEVKKPDKSELSLQNIKRCYPDDSTSPSVIRIYRRILSIDCIGVLQLSKKPERYFVADDFEALLHEMEAAIPGAKPQVKSYTSAREHFRIFFPGGFKDPKFEADERDGKTQAARLLSPLAANDLSVADATNCMSAALVLLGKNKEQPLHMTEASDLKAVWNGPKAEWFVKGVQAWVSGDRQGGIKAMHRACEDVRHSWPMFTLFPSLIAPKTDAVLRPQPVKAFANGVKSVFASIYEPFPQPTVYSEYLTFLDQVSHETQELYPRDYLDLTGFIWVANSYPAEDKTPA